MSEDRGLCVASEVDEVADAIDAARLLAECLEQEQLATAEDARRAPRLVTAVLNIALARLRQLASASRGSVDPSVLIAPHNQETGSNSGLRLRAWKKSKRKVHKSE